jgi:NAD(P)-dependent dehydrogenase (short-subunit alcohol dehydrogenase family)
MTDSDRPVALVTGAGSGIGLATARLLARSGFRVALAGRRLEPLREAGAGLGADGEDWVALPADVSVTEQARLLVGRVLDAFGRIDAVVNNAGWTPMKPVSACTSDDVERLFAVNAIGPIVITIEALRHMQETGSGRIVQVSSMASGDPFPGLTVYGGAKAALNTLTKGIANEVGREGGIRVFSVAPGAVETPLLRSILPEDQLPTEACLTPGAVAEVIGACVRGERDAESGETIWVPSP